MIDENDFSEIKDEIYKTYGKFEPYTMDEPVSGVVHLGKRSGGWKFLWDPNIFSIRNGHMEYNEDHTSGHYVVDPDSVRYIYPLTKQGIKKFIDREDVEVYDEYGEKQDKDTFFKEALEWVTWRGKEAYDAALYEKDNPNEPRYVLDNEYIRLLKSEGIKFTSYTNSDFYSDGLRFASFNDFS